MCVFRLPLYLSVSFVFSSPYGLYSPFIPEVPLSRFLNSIFRRMMDHIWPGITASVMEQSRPEN